MNVPSWLTSRVFIALLLIWMALLIALAWMVFA